MADVMTPKRVTHKDVAEHAGVSVATVSYVFNNGPRPVSAATRAKVEAAIAELGTIPMRWRAVCAYNRALRLA